MAGKRGGESKREKGIDVKSERITGSVIMKKKYVEEYIGEKKRGKKKKQEKTGIKVRSRMGQSSLVPGVGF